MRAGPAREVPFGPSLRYQRPANWERLKPVKGRRAGGALRTHNGFARCRDRRIRPRIRAGHHGHGDAVRRDRGVDREDTGDQGRTARPCARGSAGLTAWPPEERPSRHGPGCSNARRRYGPAPRLRWSCTPRSDGRRQTVPIAPAGHQGSSGPGRACLQRRRGRRGPRPTAAVVQAGQAPAMARS